MTLPDEVSQLYEQIKPLVRAEEFKEANKLLFENRILVDQYWKILLQHVILRHNYKVGKFLLNDFVKRFPKKELLEELHRLDPEVEKCFLEGIKDYLNAEDFPIKLEKYQKTREVVHNVARNNLGVPLERKAFP